MLPLYAILLPVFLLFCGLTLDVANLELAKLSMQNAADAAALGAQVAHDREDSTYIAQGIADAGLNGYTNGVNGVTVSISDTPSSGDYSGYNDVIVATVSQPISTYFMGLAGLSTVSVSSSSQSIVTPCAYFTGAKGLTTYALNLSSPSGSSIGYWGGSNMGCTVYVGTSLFVGSISSLWANATDIVDPGSSSSISGGVYHAPRYGAAAVTDPLSGIAQPSFSSCSHPAGTGVAAGTAAVHITANGTYVLNPGTYCGGLNFSGGGTFTLNPGLYIICGGGTWNGVTVNGSGVTLFFTTQTAGSGYGQFIVENGTYTLSAPTVSSNNSIPKILLFGDRNWVHTAAQDFQFLAGVYKGDGIYYTTGTGIEVSGSTFSGTNYFGFDTDNLYAVSSAICPLGNYSAFSNGNPFGHLGGLVE
jgi:Flp pilus assembly protein TadG